MLVGISVVLVIMLGVQLLAARLFGRSLFGAPSLFEASLGKVVVAFVSGPAVAYVLAAGMFFGFALMDGERVASLEVEPVPGLAAERAGVEAGDRVVSVGGRVIEIWDQVPSEVRARGDEPFELVVERSGRRVALTVTPEDGKIGLRSRVVRRDRSLPDAAAYGLAAPVRIVSATYAALVGPSEVEVSGPVSVMRHASSSGTRGIGFFLLGNAVTVSLPFALVLDLGLFGVLWLVRARGLRGSASG